MLPPQSPAVLRTPRPLLIHVGYHKTATTWLQNIVFTAKNHFHQVMSHEEIFATVIAPHGLAFDPGPATDLIARHRQEAPEDAAVDVISLEALSGLPYDGGRESDAYARRLAAIAPDARILITVRAQPAVMASVYMQHIQRAGTVPLADFFDETPFTGYSKFSAENFCYHRLVGLYQELFGAEAVLVLPQEMIAADQPAAVRLLAEFSGNAPLLAAGWSAQRERGLSYPQIAVPVLRRANYFRRDALNPNPMIDLGGLGQLIYRGLGWLARKLPKSLTRRRPVTDYVRKRFAGRFADSNRTLGSMLAYPVDLSAYEGLDTAGAAPVSHAKQRVAQRP